jgi:hypothetical protein
MQRLREHNLQLKEARDRARSAQREIKRKTALARMGELGYPTLEELAEVQRLAVLANDVELRLKRLIAALLPMSARR